MPEFESYADMWHEFNRRHESSRVSRARAIVSGRQQPEQDSSGRLLRRPTVCPEADRLVEKYLEEKNGVKYCIECVG